MKVISSTYNKRFTDLKLTKFLKKTLPSIYEFLNLGKIQDKGRLKKNQTWAKGQTGGEGFSRRVPNLLTENFYCFKISYML